MMISLTELTVAAVLWPFLAYGLGSMLPWVARHGGRTMRAIPPQVLGTVADVLAAILAAVAVGVA